MYIGNLNGKNMAHHIYNINHTAAKKNQTLNGTKKKDGEQKDMVTLSPAGKKQSMLEQLMKQKDFLQEKKQSLLDSADKCGSSSMNEQLKELDKQVEALDNQISKIQTEQTDESDSKDKPGKIYEKPKTKEEAQTEQLNQITQLSNSGDQTKIISSVKEHIEGRTRVLKSEIKSGYGAIKKKMEEVSNLETKSQELSSRLADSLDETMDSIKKSADNEHDMDSLSKTDMIKTDQRKDQEEETLSAILPEARRNDTFLKNKI